MPRSTPCLLPSFESGTIADARVASSSITQHEADITITESQISDLHHPTQSDLTIDHLHTLSGVAASSDDLGTFTGSTIADNETIKGALQDLETAHEEVDENVDDLVTLTGANENDTTLGAFSGSTLGGTETIKSALQTLETAVETKATDVKVDEIDDNVDDLTTGCWHRRAGNPPGHLHRFYHLRQPYCLAGTPRTGDPA